MTELFHLPTDGQVSHNANKFVMVKIYHSLSINLFALEIKVMVPKQNLWIIHSSEEQESNN